MGTCAPYLRRDTFIPVTKTSKEILTIESVNFPPLVGTLEKQNLNKFCDYHRDRRHNTNDYYHLKKQIEEAVASGKLVHLVKDIRRGNQRNENAPIILEGMIEGYLVRRIYIDGGSSSEIMYKHCFKNIDADIKSRLRKSNAPLVGFSGEIYHPLGLVDLRVTMGERGRSKIVLLEFAIVKCRSPYNVIMGRTRIRSLEAVGSTIHLMIKFPTTRGVATMETNKEALIREQAILRARSIPNQRPGKEPMMPEET
ncbi:hypothetical protein Tco_0874546 [Tanacetum coccineum]|uniref:Reverse transcriptase domain-containing protein n=1 Tax=Tanacetum coccineum TaxID=301880 RepID=A0ABQ5BLW6_9ASTR